MSGRRLKHVCTAEAGGTPDTEDVGFWTDDGGIPWIAITDMSSQPVVMGTAKSVTRLGAAASRLEVGRPGTVLLAMYASVGATATLGMPAVWNQAILGLTPRAGLADARFLRYWLESIRPDWTPLVRSNTQDNLNAEVVGNAPFSDMPDGFQRSIADYLDGETASIDGLLGRRRAAIDLVTERSSTVVEEALASARRRFGEIPIRRLAEAIIVGVVVRPATFYAASGWPFLRGQNLSAAGVSDTDPRYISDADNLAHSKSILRDGDVLVSRVGLTGQAAEVPAWAVGGNCVGMLVVRTGRGLNPAFTALVINSPGGQSQLQALSGGSVQDVLNASALDTLLVPNLSLETQSELVEQLRPVLAMHQLLAASINRQVALLLERRQALISAAVTGQIEIPGVAA